MSTYSAMIIEITKNGVKTSYTCPFKEKVTTREVYSSYVYPSTKYAAGNYFVDLNPVQYSTYYTESGSAWVSTATANPSFPITQTLNASSPTITGTSYIASNLAIKATAGGTVTGTQSAAYEKYGTSHSPSAGTASAGYRWDGWYSSDTKDANAAACTTLVSTNQSITFTTGGQDKTYYAKYTDIRHTLTVTPPNALHGSVAVYVGDTIGTLAVVTPDGSGHVTVNEDQYVRVIATPTATYKFVKWDGPGTDQSFDATYTFIMGSADATVTVDFDPKALYTIAWRVNDGSFPFDPEPNPATVAGCSLAFDGYADTDPPIETDPADKWYEGTHSITGTAGTGWRRIAWSVINADTGAEISRSSDLPLDATFSFNVTGNTIIQCDFYKIPYTVRAFVHTASQKAGVTAEITYNGSTGTTIPDVYHGDTVTFDAAVGAYHFGGWYNAGGTLLSSNASYTPTITADTDIYLKVKGTVLLAATVGGAASGTVSIDAETAGASATKDIILGETCTILSTPGASSSFDCWFLTSETKDSPIAGYDASQVITVTDDVSLSSYVVLTASLTLRYVAVIVYDNVTSDPDGTKGTVSLPVVSGVTEMTKAAWETATGVESPATTAGDTSASHKYYSFLGTRSTAVTATATAPDTAPFLTWYRNKLEGVPYEQTISITTESLGNANPLTAITTTGFILKAFFGFPAEVDVTCDYVNGIDPAIGSISMEPVTADRVVVGTQLQDVYTQGEEVTFSTDVANGYMFAGWFSDAAGANLVSLEPVYTATIALPLSLYAKFALDDHAIYKWEGAATNKTLTWRSKRYMSSKPFSLSTSRVYADLYPLTFNLYVSSSPNAPSPTVPDATVTIANEEPRRLASIRREKYVELEVVASGDVTQIAVAGSMEGLVP